MEKHNRSRVKGAEENKVTSLTNPWKWIAEQVLGGIVSGQILLRATKALEVVETHDPPCFKVTEGDKVICLRVYVN